MIIPFMRYKVKKNIAYKVTFAERRKMFYEKLEKILKEKHLTLNKLSKGAGFAQSPTSRWKTGTMPSAETLAKICKYLNVSADYLLDLDTGAPPPILTDQEQQLLEHFRQCSPGEKESILLLANAGAAKAEQEKESSISENVG